MSKAIAYPKSATQRSMFEKIVSAIRTSYWIYRCKNLSYRQLIKRTVWVVDQILEAHDLRNSFYQNKFSEIRIGSETGLLFEIIKSPRENILISLHKTVDFGQLTYDVVLRYQDRKIVGLNHMTVGFCTDSEFQERDSFTLNPEVLVELILALPDLSSGTPSRIRVANYEQEFDFDEHETATEKNIVPRKADLKLCPTDAETSE